MQLRDLHVAIVGFATKPAPYLGVQQAANPRSHVVMQLRDLHVAGYTNLAFVNAHSIDASSLLPSTA